MDYPKVPHSHIVPAGYLRAWADGRRIAMRRAGELESILVGVRDAGVRTDFYRRTRPSGETSYDIEWSLGQGEQAALPVVASLPEKWPLEIEDKAKVGQFFALQHLRGPAFKAWHEADLSPRIEALRADPAKYTTPSLEMTPEEAIERYAAHLTSDTYRNTRMLSIVRSVGIIMSSMHWTLVEFAKPRLVTSDHPVVVWPVDRGGSRPRPNDLSTGVIDTLEVFVPIGPAHLLLMTWVHDEDAQKAVGGAGRHIDTANAFVVANADAQWFHEPGAEPKLAKGPRPPLSAELVEAYDAELARRSPRRREAKALAAAEAASALSNDPVSIVNVTRRS